MPNPIKVMRITSPYGWRIHPIKKTKRFHYGIDIGAPKGTDIHCIKCGTVEGVYNKGAYGKHLKIDHGNEIISFYAHCSEILVRKGDLIQEDQVVAKVGTTGWSTGPHLHFGIYINGKSVDPEEYLKEGNKKVEVIKELEIVKEGKKYRGWLLKADNEYIAVNETRAFAESNGQDVIAKIDEGKVVVTSGAYEKLREIQNIVKGVK